MTTLPISSRKSMTPALRTERGVSRPIARARAPQKVGWLIFMLCFLVAGLVGGIGTWAVTAPMQSAVQAGGKFGVLGNRRVIQHLEGGIVRDIAIREGDKVREGDVIAVLDDTRPRAAMRIMENQLANALATDARLEAEFANRSSIAISDELAELVQRNPDLRSVLQTQKDLFTANRRLINGRIEILLDRTAQLERQRDGVVQRIAAQKKQVALLQEDLVGIESLVEKGLATRSRLLAMRLDESELIGEIAVSETDLQSIDQQISEQKENQLQVTRDALTAIAEQRQSNRQELNDIRQRYAAAEDVLERTTIRAPSAGTIMDLTLNTLGQVIAPGQEVAEILPDDVSVAVEVQIRPDDIDQVSPGGEARVRLTAYNMRTTPTVMGRVVRVSPDSFTDAASGESYYQAFVELEEDALDSLPAVSVLPGMQAQVMIATGEQTLADYLLSPIVGGMELALSDSM